MVLVTVLMKEFTVVRVVRVADVGALWSWLGGARWSVYGEPYRPVDKNGASVFEVPFGKTGVEGVKRWFLSSIFGPVPSVSVTDLTPGSRGSNAFAANDDALPSSEPSRDPMVLAE